MGDFSIYASIKLINWSYNDVFVAHLTETYWDFYVVTPDFIQGVPLPRLEDLNQSTIVAPFSWYPAVYKIQDSILQDEFEAKPQWRTSRTQTGKIE